MIRGIRGHRVFQAVWPWVELIAGCYIMACAFTIFFVPNAIGPRRSDRHCDADRM